MEFGGGRAGAEQLRSARLTSASTGREAQQYSSYVSVAIDVALIFAGSSAFGAAVYAHDAEEAVLRNVTAAVVELATMNQAAQLNSA